jgi:integrase
MPKLTAARVRAISHPGGELNRPMRIGDAAGLYLQITPNGAKSWLFRFTRQGKAREMGLGSCDPDGRAGVSLAEARELAAAAKRHLINGRDPIDEREKEIREREIAFQARREAEKNATEHTFAKAFNGYFEAHRSGWSSPRYAQQWRSTVERFALPVIGNIDVAQVSTNHILEVLKPIWQQMPITASHTRQRIEAVMDYAAAPARKWRSADLINPASWAALKTELPSVSKIHNTRNHPSLPWVQVSAFMTALGKLDGIPAKCVTFVILTASRPSEARNATWNEIDLDNLIWTKPAVHMKKRRLHRVPISKPAAELLLNMKALSYDRPHGLIFPPPYSGKALADKELSGLVKKMSLAGIADGQPPRWRDAENRAVDLHGFRTSFKAWCRTKNYPDEFSELALAHVESDKTRRAYAREDLLDERRPMMDAWSRLCTSQVSSITNIREARRR